MSTTHTDHHHQQPATQAWRYSTELGRMVLVTIEGACAVCGGQADQCDATGRALCSGCRPASAPDDAAATYDDRDDDVIADEQDGDDDSGAECAEEE
jgi:hypothetical protein